MPRPVLLMWSSPPDLALCRAPACVPLAPLASPPAPLVAAAAPLGFSLYLDLLAPYVLLNYLRLFHNVLADALLFLEDRAIVHNDLFLGYRHHDLLVSDLGLRGLALYERPLYRDLFVPCGHLYA